jgi:hypothetical protein
MHSFTLQVILQTPFLVRVMSDDAIYRFKQVICERKKEIDLEEDLPEVAKDEEFIGTSNQSSKKA